MTLLLTTEAAASEAIPAIFTNEWWSEFTRSPGLAGVLAVIAAFVAYRGATSTAKLNAAASREGKRRDRWWAMYLWFLGEQRHVEQDRATMMLEALGNDAETDFEKTLVAAASDAYLKEDEGG